MNIVCLVWKQLVRTHRLTQTLSVCMEWRVDSSGLEKAPAWALSRLADTEVWCEKNRMENVVGQVFSSRSNGSAHVERWNTSGMVEDIFRRRGMCKSRLIAWSTMLDFGLNGIFIFSVHIIITIFEAIILCSTPIPFHNDSRMIFFKSISSYRDAFLAPFGVLCCDQQQHRTKLPQNICSDINVYDTKQQENVIVMLIVAIFIWHRSSLYSKWISIC